MAKKGYCTRLRKMKGELWTIKGNVEKFNRNYPHSKLSVRSPESGSILEEIHRVDAQINVSCRRRK